MGTDMYDPMWRVAACIARGTTCTAGGRASAAGGVSKTKGYCVGLTAIFFGVLLKCGPVCLGHGTSPAQWSELKRTHVRTHV